MDEDFDLKQLANAPIAEVPWFFRLGHFLSKRKIRGGDRLLSEVRRRGLLDQLVIYSLGGDVRLRVPLWRPCNQWLEDDVRAYEKAFMRVLSENVCQLPGAVTLVDCGADIGTVSAHLVSRCKNIKRVIAFEPNAAAFPILAENLSALHMETEAHNAAVDQFSGRARLVHASEDPSAHAMFTEPASDGSIQVVRIDDVPIARGASCVIKIDVEGSEAAVVAGAERTIREAGPLVVAFEAHSRVAERRGRDPVEVMQALLALRRDFTFAVDTVPSRELDPQRNVFDQLPPKLVYNVVARSGGESA